MTVTDNHTEHQDHSGAHHEAPEVVDGRQRLAIWLFIGGDFVSMGALMFTYLYLRGVNTTNGWMSIVGMPTQGRTLATLEAGDYTPITNIESKLSTSLNWEIVLALVVSAAILWIGERQLRAARTNDRSFPFYAILASASATVAIWLQLEQLQKVPQYFVSSNDSSVLMHTTYGSAMMALGTSAIIHAVILILLGIGLTIRSARGVISHDRWFQVRLVRFFWVWVAVSSVILGGMTTLFAGH